DACALAAEAWAEAEDAGGCGGAGGGSSSDELCSMAEELCRKCQTNASAFQPAGNQSGLAAALEGSDPADTEGMSLAELDSGALQMKCAFAGKTEWNQVHCKHCGAHWQTGEKKKARKGKGTDRDGWNQGKLGDFPPGLGGKVPLPVGAQAGGKDPVPDLSIEDVRQIIELANKGKNAPLAQYYESVLVAKDRTAVSPQVRADQANRSIVKLEGELRVQTTTLADMHEQVQKQQEVVSTTMAELAAQEEIYKQAITELHCTISSAQPEGAASAKKVVSLGDILSGKDTDWDLSCGDDLFGLGEYIDLQGSDVKEAKDREARPKTQFRELATNLFGELKAKAEGAQKEQEELRARLAGNKERREKAQALLAKGIGKSKEVEGQASL
ncbi:unnamed protein product, partial [Prorocentrum cordatum]